MLLRGFPDVNFVAATLFFLECYHIIGHVLILLRVRLLPRKDLARVRWYFLADTTTVFLVNFVVTDRFRPVAVIQIIQHLYYFLTWEKSTLAKKVISWSSLDWQKGPESQKWQWFEVLGTNFDILLHAANAFILSQMLFTAEVIIALLGVQCLTYIVLYNPRFAWSSPYEIPNWVQKRIKPIERSVHY